MASERGRGVKIAFITAGAAGMFCGSCMRDNTLVTALQELGHDALLIPTYTPIRTDEVDVSEGRIFYGGINVYLQDKSWLFRKAPRVVDWLLNRRWLLRWASRQAVTTDYGDFADLTLSMLRGTDGRQAKELAKLVDWLAADVQPEVVVLTNALLSGLVPSLAKNLKVPIFITLQGDDIFLNALPAHARTQCLQQIRANDRHVAGYLSTSSRYADAMAPYFGIDRAKIDTVPPGLQLRGHGGATTPRTGPPVVGYFARICPEKGFHNLIDAFVRLRQDPAMAGVTLRASGWLGEQYRGFYDAQLLKLQAANLLQDFEYIDSPDHASKVRFLQSVDVLTVPTDYHEPKGLYVLEAWANGVPVVQPAHGSFPELLDRVRGGLLSDPGDANHLASQLKVLLTDAALRARLGRQGREGVAEHFTAARMAEGTVRVLEKALARPVAIS